MADALRLSQAEFIGAGVREVLLYIAKPLHALCKAAMQAFDWAPHDEKTWVGAYEAAVGRSMHKGISQMVADEGHVADVMVTLRTMQRYFVLVFQPALSAAHGLTLDQSHGYQRLARDIDRILAARHWFAHGNIESAAEASTMLSAAVFVCTMFGLEEERKVLEARKAVLTSALESSERTEFLSAALMVRILAACDEALGSALGHDLQNKCAMLQKVAKQAIQQAAAQNKQGGGGGGATAAGAGAASRGAKEAEEKDEQGRAWLDAHLPSSPGKKGKPNYSALIKHADAVKRQRDGFMHGTGAWSVAASKDAAAIVVGLLAALGMDTAPIEGGCLAALAALEHVAEARVAVARGQAQAVCRMPLTRMDLVGREEDLRVLLAALETPGARVVLHGPPGVGKSELMKLVSRERPVPVMGWLTATTDAIMAEDLASFARDVCGDVGDDAAVLRALRERFEQEERWFLAVDDVRRDGERAAAQLCPGHGAVLFSSQDLGTAWPVQPAKQTASCSICGARS